MASCNPFKSMPEAQLIVFIKAPRPGYVKTRLAATLGAAAAARVYAQMTGILLKQLAPLRNVELRYAPDDAFAEIQPFLRDGWTAFPQGAGNLGARLHAAFAETFARGAKQVVVIGSDCPTVRTHDIETAWLHLATHDVVIGPANDGGYWLVGLRKPCPSLFDGIRWSTAAVLSDTTERARRAGLSMQLLRPLTDIDTEDQWREFLARHGSAVPKLA